MKKRHVLKVAYFWFNMFVHKLKPEVANIKDMSALNNILGRLLWQQFSPDTRIIATFLDILTAILASKSVILSEWISWIPGTTKAGSRARRFIRWLDNSSIDHHIWYTPIFLYALRNWSQMPIFLALDTSMLYDRFCCVQISMLYMNRAIPVTWCVLPHSSSSVKYEQYSHLLDLAVTLLPRKVEIFFLADRGFVCKALMRRLQQLRWNWRIRVKGNQKLRTTGSFIVPKTLPLSPGKAILFSRRLNFGKGLERISLSAGWARGSQEPWYVLSPDAASIEVFMNYARRFGIEEGFRDEKSGGCGLESGRIRDAKKLERLMLVISTAQIIAVSEGISATLEGEREQVDQHQMRNLSYFQVGLRWILRYLLHGAKKLFCHCLLRPMAEPIPVASTKKESRKRRKMKMPTYLFGHVQYVTL